MAFIIRLKTSQAPGSTVFESFLQADNHIFPVKKIRDKRQATKQVLGAGPGESLVVPKPRCFNSCSGFLWLIFQSLQTCMQLRGTYTWMRLCQGYSDRPSSMGHVAVVRTECLCYCSDSVCWWVRVVPQPKPGSGVDFNLLYHLEYEGHKASVQWVKHMVTFLDHVITEDIPS